MLLVVVTVCTVVVVKGKAYGAGLVELMVLGRCVDVGGIFQHAIGVSCLGLCWCSWLVWCILPCLCHALWECAKICQTGGLPIGQVAYLAGQWSSHRRASLHGLGAITQCSKVEVFDVFGIGS